MRFYLGVGKYTPNLSVIGDINATELETMKGDG
jgi:hypothetical protein